MKPALEIFRHYFDADINVLPIRTDGSKAPAVLEWAELRKRRNTIDEISCWSGKGNGVAAICGAISGHLEAIDFDDEDVYQAWLVLVRELLGSDFLDNLLIVRTPRPGRHVIFRCPAGIGPSQKLAECKVANSEYDPLKKGSRPEILKTLIETKGEGGYILLPGCPAACHETGRLYELRQGDFANIPVITAEEREIMLSCARSLSRIVREEHRSRQSPQARSDGEDLPGDDFNTRGPDWNELLTPYGFKFHSRRGETSYWSRPGKNGGISASTNHGGHDCFYPFSTSLPFNTESGYRKFAVYAILEHDGDFSAAARELACQGYGGKPLLAIQPVEQPAPAPIFAEENVLAAATALAQVMHTPTEDNVALLFEQRFAGTLRYCKTWGFWLWWDGSHWCMDRTDRALDFCRGLARTVNTKGKSTIAKKSFASGVEAFARAARSFATEPDQWDREVFFLNTPDGVEELESPHENT